MKKMATSLSNYWVKFFTGAGFPLDVATKHAVVFSNNRIKPDMLPDLDKPSLKEMGITLMGDMIAILRYAKKVSEEMTCERFLVDNVDDQSTSSITQVQAIKSATKINPIKSGVKKITPKSSVILNKSINPMKFTVNSDKESLKLSNSLSSQLAVKKKSMGSNSRIGIQAIDSNVSQVRKRKVVEKLEMTDSSESEFEEWTQQMQKRLKVTNVNKSDEINGMKNYKTPVGRVQQKVLTNQKIRSSQLLSGSTQNSNKKILEQKRTVFDRLGDSSVTSTTNLSEPSTTFNVTGLGSDVLKRNTSVFNRLGDRDVKNESSQSTLAYVRNGTVKNGSQQRQQQQQQQQPHGILKSKASNMGSTTKVQLMNSNSISKMSGGTMHADHEKNKMILISNSVKQLVKNTKTMKLNNNSMPIGKNIGRMSLSKLAASERGDVLPAKARLGLSGSQKQVTFNKIATVKHIKKPGVFSRLGV